MRLGVGKHVTAVRRRLARPGGWRPLALALALVWCVSRAMVVFHGETLRDRMLYRVAVLRDTGNVTIVRDGSSLPDSAFTNEQLQDFRTLYHWVSTNTTWCRRQASFGGQAYSNRYWESRIHDGDRPVCLDPGFAMADAAAGREPCVVYAFGISYDWTFDDAMARFGCEVHSFDPSIGEQPARRPSGVHFHPVGLGRNDHVNVYGWTIWTIERALRELGHAHLPRLHYLKLDSEGSEWDMFAQQLFDGGGHEALDKFDQIGVEVHMRKHAETELEFYQRVANITTRLAALGWQVAEATPTKIYPIWFRFPGLAAPQPLMYDLLLVNRRQNRRAAPSAA